MLVVVSALLVIACFPPFSLWPLALVAWVPLLYAITETSSKKSFYYGLLHGCIVFGGTLSWLLNIFHEVAILLILILALFTGIFCLLCRITTSHLKSVVAKVLAVGVFWTAIEYFRSEMFVLCFSWITPGMALGPIALTPVIGIYGTSFMVIVTSALLYYKSSRKLGLAMVATLFLMTLFRLPIVPIEPNAIKVAAIQDESMDLASFISQTYQLKEQEPDLVIWPEYTVGYDLRNNDPANYAVVKEMLKDIDTILLFGTKTERDDLRWHNTALAISHDEVLGEHYKNHTVHLIDDGVRGDTAEPITMPFGRAGTPICFDYDYGDVMRKMTLNGAQFFAVPSCDPMYWSERQHLQHSSLLPIRAAENGRWTVCAATSGISSIIDPHGNTHKSIPAMEQDVLIGYINTRDDITFFTRIGWIFPILCLIAAGLLLLFVMSKHLKQVAIALAVLSMYGAMILGMHIFHSGWIAIVGYHVVIIITLAVTGGLPKRADLLKGWHKEVGISSLVICVIAGPLIYFLWPYIHQAGIDFSETLAGLELSGLSLTLFAIYYITVNPWLEEIFWRGWLPTAIKDPILSDIGFAGYHVVVLALFIKTFWIVVCFAVLILTAHVWRLIRKKYEGLVIPILAHLVADISIITTAILLK